NRIGPSGPTVSELRSLTAGAPEPVVECWSVGVFFIAAAPGGCAPLSVRRTVYHNLDEQAVSACAVAENPNPSRRFPAAHHLRCREASQRNPSVARPVERWFGRRRSRQQIGNERRHLPMQPPPIARAHPDLQ